MTKKHGEPFFISGNDEQEQRLMMAANEMQAIMIANNIVGAIYLTLPGNAEVRLQFDAPWMAVSLDGTRLVSKPDMTVEQEANTCNVFRLLSTLLTESGDEITQVSRGFQDATDMEVVHDSMHHTHKLPRKPN